MSFIILPKNTARDAVLVEVKNGTSVVIDDSTPIEVNVQQPVTVSGTVTVDNADTNPVPIELAQEPKVQQEEIIDLLTDINQQLKIIGFHMALMTDEKITKDDI